MITPASPNTARFAARASLALLALGFALLATPAHAEAAEGWSDPTDVNTLHALLLLGGVPLLLFVLIGLAVYIPALVRGEDVSVHGGGVDNQWIGGPRRGAKQLAAGDDEPNETGGARGSW